MHVQKSLGALFPCVILVYFFAVLRSAGMYIWAKLPDGLGVDDLEFCQQLVAETGIALSPGRGFGPGGMGYVRFALVQPEAVLQRAAETVGMFAETLRAAHAGTVEATAAATPAVMQAQ